MRRDGSVLLLFFLLPSFASAQQTDRIAVRVLDPAGEKPLAGAGVSCADPAGPGATVGADGRIPVLAACKKVRCWADGFLPGAAEVAGPSADCRVTAAARIEGPVRGLVSAEGMEARLYAVGILVNVADSPADSDFIVPALVERGPLTISIATEGLAPALSRKIRMDLERYFGPEYSRYTRLIGEARSAIDKNTQITAKQKRKALLSLLSMAIREGLARGEKISRRDVLKKLGVI